MPRLVDVKLSPIDICRSGSKYKPRLHKYLSVFVGVFSVMALNPLPACFHLLDFALSSHGEITE